MSDSQVIALRFRPKTFDQVIGQEPITRTLRNAIESGRLHHAYLFAGARGVGKTTTARILAKALNCERGPTTDPCGVCPSCREIARSASVDVLEIDAASNTGIENVRNAIISSAPSAPWRDRYRIFIIDEVHQLSIQSFNALLKTIEEPPPGVVFIMATTLPHKVPETILSRCQVFEFRTIPLKAILQELRRVAGELGVEISDSALAALARAGEGSMRDAESALDQVISFAGKVIKDEDVAAALGIVDAETLNKTIGAIAGQDARTLVRIVEDVVSRGCDLRNFCRELMTHVRALLVIKIAGLDPELVQMPPAEGEPLVRLAERFSEQDLIRLFSILTKTEQDIRLSSQPRFQLEIGLVRMAQTKRLYLVEEALARLERLQLQLGATRTEPPSTEVRSDLPPRPAQLRNTAMRPTVPDRPKGMRLMGPARVTEGPLDDRARGSNVTRSGGPPPEPPPIVYEPLEVETRAFESQAARPEPAAASDSADGSLAGDPAAGSALVIKVKDALERRRKMLILSELNLAESIAVDGDFLTVKYPASMKQYKAKLGTPETRFALEEASVEALGRKLSLRIEIEGDAGGQQGVREKEDRTPERPENHPAIKTLLDKFQGEVIEVVKPKG